MSDFPLKRIYICGNELVDMDSMPFKILDGLKKQLPETEFISFDPTENFPVDDPLFIVDTVVGIDHVMIIDNVEQLADAPHFSAHDADLAFHLKWLKKMDELPKVVIFGVPDKGEQDAILDELVNQVHLSFKK